MKNRLLFAATALCVSSLTAQTQDLGNYCAVGVGPSYNMVEYVKINNQTQTIGTEGNVGTDTGDPYYGYYETNSFPVLNGNVNLEIGFYSVDDGEPMYFSVWIDYNHNDAFEESERVMENQNTTMAALNTFTAPDQDIAKTITIPQSALAGATRMRLYRGQKQNGDIYNYDANFHLDPCAPAGFSYGCYFDFKVTVGTAGLTELENSTTTVYPNPTSEQLVVVNASQQEVVSYEIMTIAGERVTSASFTGTAIDVSSLAPGTYLIRIDKNDGSIGVSRWVKN